ncbi:MAG: NAD-dependent epimerase [Thaumarchaeota archaeon]|nr:MAG: NAD-dependent epimerase [Nitrososphaerota archaeon]
MKYVVTGGAGFIGSHIVKFLVGEKHTVIVIDNLQVGTKKRLESIKEKIDFHQTDILNFNEVEKIVQGADGVFHQAALTSLPESFEKPEEYHNVNVNGTENIFKLSKKYGFKVVYASSSSVYGEVKKIPISENFEKNPLNPYAETKLQDELLALKYSKLGSKIIGLRYFNVFGKGQTGSYAGVITKFINKVIQKESPEIFGKGNQIRDFVSVEDVVQANYLAMTNNVSAGFFNIGTGKTYSILEIAEIIINAASLLQKPIFRDALPGDALLSKADIKLAKSILNWEPKLDLKIWLENEIPKIIKKNKN